MSEDPSLELKMFDIPDGVTHVMFWKDDEEAVAPRYDREVLVDVIIHHGRTNIRGCHCGWAVMGASHAEHVADEYERALSQKDDAQG